MAKEEAKAEEEPKIGLSTWSPEREESAIHRGLKQAGPETRGKDFHLHP